MSAYLLSLAIILGMAFITWIYTLPKRDVSIVDSLWSLMFLAAAIVFIAAHESINTRSLFIFTLIFLWSIRLSGFLLLRNWGEPEDKRYQQIRANNEPFWIKSLYIVFGLQGLLAWIISIPLFFALKENSVVSLLDGFAALLWLTGFLFEAVSDWQLYQFKKSSENEGKVLDGGLWAYSRHPNYFGEFLIWWSYFLFAIPSGGWWSIYAPLLMNALLLKVSGVSLMEKTIGERRPAYADYVRRTNAFFPGVPRT